MLLLFFLIIIGLEIPITGLNESIILIVLIILIYSFVFALSFFIRGFYYAFKFTAITSILIPLSILIYQYFEQLYHDSALYFWLILILLISVMFICVFLILRYSWRKTFNQLTIFKRKSKFIAFSNNAPISKPYGNTAVNVSLKLKDKQNSYLDIMQIRPADMFSYQGQRWALAGITFDEEAHEASFLIYAHPLMITKIEHYFKRWNPYSLKIDAKPDENYELYKKILPTRDEYFSIFNTIALSFYNLSENSINGAAKVLFITAFTDSSQMDSVEALFDQVHLNVVERHEPKFDEDGLSEYGGFILEGEMPINLGMANQMTKSIIELLSQYNGELYRWDPISKEMSE